MPDNSKIATVAAETLPIVGILRATDVSIPLAASNNRELPEEIQRLRTEFLRGKELSREDLSRLVMSGAEGGGGNGNCNIC